MRILHCIATLMRGGAERQLSLLASELSALGHDVHVAYLEQGPYIPHLKTSRVHLH
jgi:hypothetical protein